MDATVASWLVWSEWLGFKDKLKAAGVAYSWPTVDSSVVWKAGPLLWETANGVRGYERDDSCQQCCHEENNAPKLSLKKAHTQTE